MAAWRNGASVSLLSDVLETDPIPERFFLSKRAKEGIAMRLLERPATAKRSLPPDWVIAALRST
ncbi:hypothetical protein ASF31_05630 [Brevundimonas sp. Leaf280]|nr:hypothetical protein ASF31_05630 [Brevundimonas sp. Leaf280]